MGLKDKLSRNYFKKPVISLHWLLFIIVIFFVLYTVKESRINLLSGCIWSIGLFFMFDIVLTFLPERILEKQPVLSLVFFLDVILISMNVYFTQGFDTDLYLTYFLIIFIAGISQSIKGSVLTAMISGALYGFMLLKGTKEINLIDSGLLIRIPFLFVVALISSFFSEEAKNYKKQFEDAKRISKELQEHVRAATAELLNKNEELRNLNEDLKLKVTESEILIATLKESEQKYRNLFENAEDIIFTLNMDGIITTINKKVKNIIGYTDIDCLGQNISMFISRDDLEKFLSALELVGTNRYQIVDLRFKHINGGNVLLNVNLFPVRYSGEIIGIQGIAKRII